MNIFISIVLGSALSLPITYELLRMITNACQCLYERCQPLRTLYQRLRTSTYSQHSLEFRNRFLNWLIFVRRWAIICERYEFVTNAYEDTANVWAIVKYVLPLAYSQAYSPCGSSIKRPIFKEVDSDLWTYRMLFTKWTRTKYVPKSVADVVAVVVVVVFVMTS